MLEVNQMVSTLELRCDFKIHLTSLWCPVSTMSKRRYDNLAMIKTLLLGMIRMFTQKIFFSFSFPSFHEAEKLVLSSGSCKMSPEQPFSFHPQLSFQVFFFLDLLPSFGSMSPSTMLHNVCQTWDGLLKVGKFLSTYIISIVNMPYHLYLPNM